MKTIEEKLTEIPTPRTWLDQLPADPSAVPIAMTITLDATTWATVTHHARQRGYSVEAVLSTFILEGGRGGIVEHLS